MRNGEEGGKEERERGGERRGGREKGERREREEGRARETERSSDSVTCDDVCFPSSPQYSLACALTSLYFVIGDCEMSMYLHP